MTRPAATPPGCASARSCLVAHPYLSLLTSRASPAAVRSVAKHPGDKTWSRLATVGSGITRARVMETRARQRLARVLAAPRPGLRRWQEPLDPGDCLGGAKTTMWALSSPGRGRQGQQTGHHGGGAGTGRLLRRACTRPEPSLRQTTSTASSCTRCRVQTESGFRGSGRGG